MQLVPDSDAHFCSSLSLPSTPRLPLLPSSFPTWYSLPHFLLNCSLVTSELYDEVSHLLIAFTSLVLSLQILSS